MVGSGCCGFSFIQPVCVCVCVCMHAPGILTQGYSQAGVRRLVGCCNEAQGTASFSGEHLGSHLVLAVLVT